MKEFEMKEFETHSFYLGGSGDGVYFKTIIYDDDDRTPDEKPLIKQQFVYEGPGNEVVFNLLNVQITPTKLRALADQLETLLKNYDLLE